MSTLRAEVLRFVAEAATPRPWKILPIHSLDLGGGGGGGGMREREREEEGVRERGVGRERGRIHR